MATITQTVGGSYAEESFMLNRKSNEKTSQIFCPDGCNCRNTRPPITSAIIFNVLGMIIAILATYFIVSTDSKLYLVFWVCYSVLRRLMKKRQHVKTE